ncbi:uncharacterized protein A4U43_C05F34750 [Asparagus officinalis]|uniref:CASP-like protein n=1 Tax=Asparagus officinalis TaxID=4686 RepID=A0A5P1EWR4_ASPOF|nr:uncharacterized protein A4U43_C05F34750 [Asparagus officinalis]
MEKMSRVLRAEVFIGRRHHPFRRRDEESHVHREDSLCQGIASSLGMSYATFAATLAAGQGALIALTGVKQLQWEKLCHFYPRFCVQGAVGVALGGVSSLVMIPVALISAYRVFRLYPSPNRN